MTDRPEEVRLRDETIDYLELHANTKYTHHSCALGPDDRQYDAVGLELEWRVWER